MTETTTEYYAYMVTREQGETYGTDATEVMIQGFDRETVDGQTAATHNGETITIETPVIETPDDAAETLWGAGWRVIGEWDILSDQCTAKVERA